MNPLSSNLLFLFISALISMPVLAEVSVTDGWVRASAPGQKVGAAYMTLTSLEKSHMVYAETNRANSVEMHHMRMQDGVMKMRQLEDISLEPQQSVKLAPGDTHLMLFDLKTPLKAGEQVIFTLCFKDAAGKITHQDVTFPVK